MVRILMVSGAHVELRYVFWLSSASVSRNEHITIGTVSDNYITGLVYVQKVAGMVTWIASGHDLTILSRIKVGFPFILWFIYTVFCLFVAKVFTHITLRFSLCCK
jgi:hypothetical protein